MLKAITDAKLDAVVGYTQRFRRKWLGAKEKVRTGALGDVTLVTSRAFMNRLVAIDNYKRTDDPATISPMVISGTHALDIVMWYMEEKTPVECYARSVDKVLGPIYGGIDATAGMIMFSDGSVYHLNISWALPVTWPGAVYCLEVAINGTDGVLTIDDTHRDMVLAVSQPQEEGYAPDKTRLVDFMGSYPPGDMALGELRGPMAEETDSWLNRVALGVPTQAATAAEAHRNLMLTKALDLSAKAQGAGEAAARARRGTCGGVSRQALELLFRIILFKFPGDNDIREHTDATQFQTDWGWPSKTPALGRRPRRPHPPAARLVDGPHGAAAGALRELHVARGAAATTCSHFWCYGCLWRWMNPVPAMPGDLKRWEAHRRALRPHRPIRPDVRRLAHRLGARRHIPNVRWRSTCSGCRSRRSSAIARCTTSSKNRT